MSPETLSSWQVWAVLSAVFAALTAIFAKVGVEDINPDLAKELDLPGAFRPRHRRLVAVLFSRPETRAGDAGGADRQIERGTGGAVRRGVSRRTAVVQRLARDRADRNRRGADRREAVNRNLGYARMRPTLASPDGLRKDEFLGLAGDSTLANGAALRPIVRPHCPAIRK